MLEEPNKCKITQSSISAVNKEWMSKILYRLNIRGIEHFVRLNHHGWVAFLCKVVSEGVKIHLSKKKNKKIKEFITGDYILKITSTILAFQYFTIKHLYLGHFNIEYFTWYIMCYDIQPLSGQTRVGSPLNGPRLSANKTTMQWKLWTITLTATYFPHPIPSWGSATYFVHHFNSSSRECEIN